jgi:hypothetical protein
LHAEADSDSHVRSEPWRYGRGDESGLSGSRLGRRSGRRRRFLSILHCVTETTDDCVATEAGNGSDVTRRESSRWMQQRQAAAACDKRD